MEVGIQSMTGIEARNEMFGVLQTAWNVAVALLDPAPTETPSIIWPGEAVPEPDSALIYCTPNLEILTKNQKTLRRIQNKSLFETSAIFSTSIFAPKSDLTALSVALILGAAVEVAVSKASPSGCIWFRGARSGPANGTETQNQVNVVATCVFQNQQ
jgi:hypothetical protein